MQVSVSRSTNKLRSSGRLESPDSPQNQHVRGEFLGDLLGGGSGSGSGQQPSGNVMTQFLNTLLPGVDWNKYGTYLVVGGFGLVLLILAVAQGNRRRGLAGSRGGGGGGGGWAPGTNVIYGPGRPFGPDS